METADRKCRVQRRALALPALLMAASIVASCFCYSGAKVRLADDLNTAIVALAGEYGGQWAETDSIAALRTMQATIDQPVVYQASNLNFKHALLKHSAYFSLALIDCNTAQTKSGGNAIESDSILIIPDSAPAGTAIRLQGFADCSVASVFAASDQSVPGVLFALSLLSFGYMMYRKGGAAACPASAGLAALADLKLTPMQRRFVQMLADAPGHRVAKSELCQALWDGKDNAEESLYTLVRRTKKSIAGTDFDIACNRGESYELRIND